MRQLEPFDSGAGDKSQPMGMLARKLARHTDLGSGDGVALGTLTSQNVRALRHRSLIDRDLETGPIHIMIAGWACRFAVLPSGRRRILAFYLPGDICDFDLFTARQIDQPIAAIGAARVAAVDRRSLRQAMNRQPQIERAFWSEAALDAAIQRSWTINVGHRAADRRLAHLLCELNVRLGATGASGGAGVAFPLTQADLGDACGLTSIHTNRAIQELRRAGLLDLSAGTLRIHDWAGLCTMASFDPAYLTVAAEEAEGDEAVGERRAAG